MTTTIREKGKTFRSVVGVAMPNLYTTIVFDLIQESTV